MADVRNILFVRTDRIGDLLMNVPVLRRLKSNYPDSRLTLLADSSAAQIVSSQPDIDEIIRLDKGQLKNFGGRLKLFADLWKRKFDCIVVSNPSKLFHSISFLLGIPLRVGLDRKWGFFLNHKMPDRKDDAACHEIDYNLELVDSICPEPWDGKIILGFDEDYGTKETHVQHRPEPRDLGSYIVLHMFTSNPKKSWDVSKIRALTQEILQKTPFRIVFVGEGAALAVWENLDEAFGERITDLCGKTTLGELAVILKNSECLVSLDSGPYHVAWMQGIPVVGIFIKDEGLSSPKRWGAYPGFSKSKEIHKVRDEITLDEVVEGVLECTRRS